MNKRTDNQVNGMLHAIKRRRWHAAMLVLLALAVATGVAGVFHLPAIAKTYRVTELSCTAVPPEGPASANFFVHIHNDDCYDAEGRLVCPLPEIRPHRHTSDCYTTSRNLVCGIPESDGHQHTADCYTRVKGELICELSTEPVLDEEGNVLEEGHVHTDECYAWTEELSCGMEQGEGAHHHDDSCYETITTLVCAEPEILLHTHTDACYQKNEDGSLYVDENGNSFLICGQLQVLEHVHGPECFTTYELDDGEPEFVFMEEELNAESETQETETADAGAENTEGDESGFVFLFPEEDEEAEAETADAEDVNTEGEEISAEAQETDPQTAEAEDGDVETESNDTEEADPADSTEPSADEENPEAAADGEDATDETAVTEEPHTVVYTGTRGAEKGGVTVLAEIPEGALDENTQLVLTDADENNARKQILKVVNEFAAEGEEREISSMLLLDIGFMSGEEPAVLNGPDPIRVTLRAAAIRGMSAPKLYHLAGGTAREVEDVIFDTQAGTVVFTSTTFSPFAIVDLTGEEQTEETTEVTAEETVSESMPAQDFHGATEEVEVFVTAPEGAFPAGTTMRVTAVPQEEVIGALNDAANGAMVRNVQAVDISFLNAENEEIEPLLPISVRMSRINREQPATPEAAPEAKESVVLHVENDGSAQLVENANVSDTEAEFESDSFSTYIMADLITEEYISADGTSYAVTLKYGPEANIPEGAYLTVREIPAQESGETADDGNADSEYADYLARTEQALEENQRVTFARFFDITIMANGEEIQPNAPVVVKIELLDPLGEEVKAIHFSNAEDGAESAATILNAQSTTTDSANSTVSFQTDGFSVFGVVVTETIETTVITADGKVCLVRVTYGPEAMIPEGSSLSVTIFEEGTEDYTYARNAVLADKLAKGERVNLSNFGLAAMDISILDPNGVEIEPAAPVQVDLTIKELPNVDNLEDVAGSIAIQHHVETESGVIIEEVYDGGAVETAFDVATKEMTVAEGTAVDPNSVHEEDFLNGEETFETSVIETSFPAEVFSTYTISYNNGYSSKRIHYVDEDGNSLTPTMIPNFDAEYQFLIYDIPEYEYSYTALRSKNGNRITPILTGSGRSLNTSGSLWYLNGSNWTDLNNDVYVVYRHKDVPTTGGTPQVDVDETWPDQEVPERKPRFTKASINNGNGTNNITLTITAPEKPVEKSTPADVIVVFDVSASMSDYMNGQTRLARAKTAVNDMADTLLNGQNSDVRMALISFSTTATQVQGFTNSYNTFREKVNGLTADGGTNWEKALQMANQMLVRNDAATFVVFVTDGDPTFRVSRGNVSDSNLDLFTGGTYQYYRWNQVFGEGDEDSYGRNFEFAVDQVSAIAGANKRFYAIGISNDVTKVQNLTTQGGVDASHAFIASNNTAMENAFKSITESIKSTLGFGNVEITDGITALTNAEMKVMQTVDPNSFKYYRYGGENNKYGNGYANKTEWTTREADGCAAATYTESDGAVHWNMGEGFQLEDGVTYVVEFMVWPSQAAYDLVADLNNGIKTFSSLTAEEKAQVVEVTAPTETTTGTYALKTNTNTVEATYNRTTKSGDVVTISDTTDVKATYLEGTIQNMNLDSDYITVKKNWNNALDDRTADQITLTVTKDGTAYLTDLTLNDNNSWTSDEQYIATGFITTTSDGRYNVRELGHEYTVTEPVEFSYYWDLTADVYRPMVINGTLFMLIKTDSPTGTEGTDYYVIDGKNYQVSSTTTPQLAANNGRRSNLNLKKMVTANTQAVDNVPDPEDVFTYTITITDPNGSDIWFSAMNDNETPVSIASYSDNVTPEIRDGNPTGYYYVQSGAEFTISIKAGPNVRFINLPKGTTYSIQESIQETGMEDGYEFVKAETSAEVTNPEYADDFQGTPGKVSGDTVTGTIDMPNNVYSTEYTNNWNPNNEIVIIKVDENDDGLADAQFKLSKMGDDGWTEIAMFASKADAGETLKIGHGMYMLEETAAAPGYTTADTVYFRVETNGNTTTVTLTDEAGKEIAQNQLSIVYPDAEASGNEVTVKNRPFKPIQIKKIGDWISTNLLSGVQFKLFSDKDCTKQITKDIKDENIGENGIITTGSDGIANIGILAAGTYYLQEVATVPGYNTLSEAIEFTINADGTIAYSTGNKNFDVIPGATYETETVIGIYISNASGVELPQTGGEGTLIFSVLGTILILSSTLLILAKRKQDAYIPRH